MKKMSLIFSLLILPILMMTVIPVYGERFHKDGREIEILWKQKRDDLHVWGKVTGGRSSCKQMNLKIYFNNSESGQSSRVSTTIKSFRPTGRNNYSAVDEIYPRYNKKFHRKSSRNKWFVEDYYLKCIN